MSICPARTSPVGTPYCTISFQSQSRSPLASFVQSCSRDFEMTKARPLRTAQQHSTAAASAKRDAMLRRAPLGGRLVLVGPREPTARPSPRFCRCPEAGQQREEPEPQIQRTINRVRTLEPAQLPLPSHPHTYTHTRTQPTDTQVVGARSVILGAVP